MDFQLTVDEGSFLTKLARRAIITFLDEGRKIGAPLDTPSPLREKRGVFVTLNKVIDGEQQLRGCIGFILPTLPLVNATIEAAISAAVHDSRFPRVRRDELKSIAIEVSVLTPPTLIEVEDPRNYVKAVEIGRDGLIVERGWNKGLLLPQVPVEWGWDVEEFLVNCCMKAGLPPDAWLVKDTKIYKFQCIIMHEVHPDGPVTLVDL